MLLLLALLLLQLRRPRSGFYTALLAVSWLYLCSTGGFALLLMDYLERDYPSKSMAVIEPADAIVLLGGAMRGHTHMGTLPDLNQQADRLVYAAALYRAGKAPLLILSGGGAEGARPESSQMKDILLLMGVPERAMVLELKSRNTHDNAVYSAEILRAKDLQRVLLVTSAFHMPRAVPLFRQQGIAVVPAATDYQRPVAAALFPAWVPGVGNLARTTLALHEIVGYWVYRWRGWL